jgi:acyl CoA:acetate/3-ketoacid CoA transferase alpha subunit
MADKLQSLKQAAAAVKSGERLVMSANIERSPMAFLREIVRNRIDNT